MNYLIYIFFGLAPSIIWLLFYLKKDSNPEPKRMIIRIFCYGMIITLVAALIEIGILAGLSKIVNESSLLAFLLYNFIGIAFIEEFFKYLIVREKVLRNPELDEPVDVMLYMIIAALGFAALENILFLLPTGQSPFFIDTISVSLFRFLGATFLHALASGIVGYFLALSFLHTKRRTILIITGLAIATFLHGLYNFSIIKTGENFSYIIIPIIALTGAALFVSFGFRRLKKLKSTCKPVK